MSYTIKYNRTSNHIGGLTVRTTGGGKDMGDHVSDYSQNACGSLTRYRFADGESFNYLVDVLETARKAGGRKLCKTCEKAAEAELERMDEAVKMAEVEERMAAATPTYGFPEVADADTPESASVPSVSANEDHSGETMAEKAATKNDVNTDQGKAVLEQIDANIERAKSLAEADNVDALKELNDETEALISSLSGKDSIKAKKAKRDAFTAASTAQEKPKAEVKKVTEGTVAPKTWDQYEGTKELASLGAEKLAEGVRMHLKASMVAKDVAAVVFDMWTRIPNTTGAPDILGDMDPSKKASGAMLRLAGEGFEDNFDNRQALKRLARSVQDQRTDVRAEWLRSLDEDTEIAAERRALMASVLEGKPEDEKASEWVANVYGTSTMGVTEKKRLEYQAKKEAAELEAAKRKGAEGGEGEGEGEDEEEVAEDTSTPDERVAAVVKKILSDFKKAKPEDFESASEEVKEAARAQLEQVNKALKAMITATL
ncbi:hypothetical protein [Streptomyces sioyaensis]|uniref:hypothetical protein n=1 Tax=Streptomyces sioyaensis TaxID=67364 RepID=UPI00379B45BB